MKIQNKKGFTLVELLVVITIIWILATWAVTTYTTYIQKSRDTNRVNEMMALKSAIEQSYWDGNEYPNIANTWSIWIYMPKIPKDIKDGSPSSSWSVLWYWYTSWADDNWVVGQRYEISIWFENIWNVESKAENTKDGGWDSTNWDAPCNVAWTWSNVRFEIWIPNTSWQLDLSSCAAWLVTNVQ